MTDGRKFIYMVKETHIGEDLDQKELAITVQADVDKPGRCMQFRYPYGEEIAPSLVALVVDEAISKGWDPSERGGAFSHKFMGESG